MGRICARLLPGVLLVGAIWLTWPRAPLSGNQAPPRDRPAQEMRDRWMGVATCASMACHHANGPQGSPRSEYTTWAGRDKHARAFQVLYDKRSERMVRNLYGDKAKATETKLCLKCHAMNNGDTNGKSVGPRFVLSDGVGCESCHGPAGPWIADHYRPSVLELPPEKKEEVWGLRNTKDLVTRARLCAECHIGTADKEVNHDLIAAGHPRLNFEFGAFTNMVPRHWQRDKERERYPDLEARAWIVGQLVSARTAIQLLKARADDAARPWPEFSEYACFACHKDLRADSPRQKAGYPGRGPGQLPWGTWYVAMMEPLAAELKLGDLRTPSQKLREQMQRSSPDTKQVSKQAGQLIEQLDSALTRTKQGQMGEAMTSERIRRLLKSIADDGARRAHAMDWGEATQLYLGLAALCHGLKESSVQPPQQLTTELLKLRDQLKQAYPPGYDSPQRFNPLADPTLESQVRTIGDLLDK